MKTFKNSFGVGRNGVQPLSTNMHLQRCVYGYPSHFSQQKVIKRRDRACAAGNKNSASITMINVFDFTALLQPVAARVQ